MFNPKEYTKEENILKTIDCNERKVIFYNLSSLPFKYRNKTMKPYENKKHKLIEIFITPELLELLNTRLESLKENTYDYYSSLINNNSLISIIFLFSIMSLSLLDVDIDNTFAIIGMISLSLLIILGSIATFINTYKFIKYSKKANTQYTKEQYTEFKQDIKQYYKSYKSEYKKEKSQINN